MFKKNSFLFGILLGLVMPALLFGILYTLNYYTHLFEHPPVYLPLQKQLFVCSALNIIPISYCFKHSDLDITGQRILSITVFLVLIIILAV